jgi:autotransporter-associated beta strand protein
MDITHHPADRAAIGIAVSRLGVFLRRRLHPRVRQPQRQLLGQLLRHLLGQPLHAAARTRLPLLLLLLMATGAVPAHAATCSWTGAGANNKWSTAANWSACAVSGPQNADVLYFLNGAAQPTNVNDLVGLTVAAIQITGVGANGRHWDISGNALTISAATSFLTAASPLDVSGASPSFMAPITLGSNIDIDNLSSGGGTTAQLRLGNIDLAGKTLTLRPDFPIAVIGTIAGDGTIIKNDTSTVTFVNNTYTGPTMINNGAIVAIGEHAFGATGGGNETFVATGGEVILANDITIAEPFILKGSGNTDGGALVAQGGVTATVSGTVSTPAGGAPTDDPVIAAGDGATLSITGDIEFTVGGTFKPLTKAGGGTLVLFNTENSFGSLLINAGTVRLGAAGVTPTASNVTVSLGATFDLHNFDDTIGSLLGGNTGTNGGTVDLGSGTLTLDGASFYGAIVGSGNLVKSSNPALLALAGTVANTYTGTTTVNGGQVYLQKTNKIAIGGPLIVNGGSVEVDADNQIAPQRPVTLNAPGQLVLGATTVTPAVHQTVGSLSGGGAVVLHQSTLTIGDDGTSTTYGGVISGTPDAATDVCLVKIGFGVQTLTGPSTYTGKTQITAGPLVINSSMPTSRIEVSGGVLAGFGTIGSATVSSGYISPGAFPSPGPGALHMESLGMSGGTFIVELNGLTAGTTYDQVDVTRFDLTLTGAPRLQLSRTFWAPAGTHFTIVKIATGAATGTFNGLPEGATLALGDAHFSITYHGGDGNDVVLTSLDDPPTLSIDDVTVTEGNVPWVPGNTASIVSAADTSAADTTAPTYAIFTVTMSRALTQTVTVDYTTVNGTATSPQDFEGTDGTLTFRPGMTTVGIFVPINGDRNREPDETFRIQLSHVQGDASVVRAQATGTILNDDLTRTYYLSEGATGGFFDEDILIANPNDATAPVTLTFSKENGEQVIATRSLAPRSHLTVHVDQIPGLEATAASAQVSSDIGVPLLVERSMFWDTTYYAGHTGSALDQPMPDWFFAEGSQGFFQTFVLVINPNPAPADVTFTFLRENDTPVVKTVTVGASTRLTLDAGSVPDIVNRSFGIAVHATLPIMTERSMYFGTTPSRLWSGGTESAGVTAPSTHWFLAEGATGGFFDTFVLLSNPQNAPAHVTLQYLLDTGETVTVPKTIAANARLTTNIEAEDDVRLHNAAVSTVVTSDVPIIAERSMYWPGAAVPWGEGHNSFGVVDAGTQWGLAEGRVGGPLNFHSYILLANPQSTAATVTVTYLRENGASAVTKTYTVPATSRFNIDTSSVTELHDESFGAVIAVTNGVNIIVERSMYWDSNGFVFSGGTNATGIPLP